MCLLVLRSGKDPKILRRRIAMLKQWNSGKFWFFHTSIYIIAMSMLAQFVSALAEVLHCMTVFPKSRQHVCFVRRRIQMSDVGFVKIMSIWCLSVQFGRRSMESIREDWYDGLSLADSHVIGGLPMCVLSYIFAWHRGSSGQRPWVRLLHSLVHCHLARLCKDLFSAAIRDRERSSRG